MANKGVYLKDYPDIPGLNDNIIFPVGDDTLGTPDDKASFKARMSAIKAYIGGGGTITPPVNLQDGSGFTTATGTIQSITNTTMSISDPTTYGLISIGDIIYVPSMPITSYKWVNIVVDKLGSYVIQVLPSQRVYSSSSYQYGPASIIMRNNSGSDPNIEAMTSTKGFGVSGSLSVGETGYFRTAVETVDLRSTERYHPQAPSEGRLEKAYSDGHMDLNKESFEASISSDYTIPSLSWRKVLFDSVTRYNTNHVNVPIDYSGYSTTNSCFIVPYHDISAGLDYTDTLVYTFHFNVFIEVNTSYSQSVECALCGTSSPTASAPSQYFLKDRKYIYIYSGTISSYPLRLSGSVSLSLSPKTNANHRYISVWILCTNPLSTYTARTGPGQCSFSGTYNSARKTT